MHLHSDCERSLIFCDLISGVLHQGGHDLQYHRSVQRAVESCGLYYQAIHIRRKKGWRLFDFIALFMKNEKPRIFFLETIPFLDLCAMSAASLFLKKKDRLILLFRFEMKRKIGKWLQYFLQKRGAILVSDSKRIFATVLPILHTDDLDGAVKPQENPQFWWPGPPREEKGKEIILRLAKQGKIYANLKAEGIHYLPELSREQYVEQLRKSAIILLPYDPKAYYARTSGPFVEAICCGKIPVVKEGSWLANELREHDLEELIVDFSSLDEIAKLAKDAKVLKKLEKMQKHYRTYHSIENFSKALASTIGT